MKSPATHDKTVEEVQELQGYSQSVISLDTPIAEDNSLTLADTLQADLNVENDTVEIGRASCRERV